MTITKYNIINTLSNKKLPYYDFKTDYFIVPFKSSYRWFVEAANYNKEKGYNEYYILVSNEKFDENCRRCETNQYGKCKFKLLGEIKDYVISECNDRGNITCDYVETCGNYDVFRIV